jgi:hypothetical protein
MMNGGAKPKREPGLWVAAPMGAVVVLAGMIPMFGGKPRAAQSEHECWVASSPSRYRVLDWVENLETCGARLEVLFLRSGQPVKGLYGGISVFVDAQSIRAAAPNGPQTSLIGPKSRRDLDQAIQTLTSRQSG